MDTVLIHNLQLLGSLAPYDNIRIVACEAAWPPEPDTLPGTMNLKSHMLQRDLRWAWVRPLLRLFSGDTSYAIVNYLMLMTRALELYQGQQHVGVHVMGAIGGLTVLQDTTYRDCRFVKLALLTCRCAWRQYCL